MFKTLRALKVYVLSITAFSCKMVRGAARGLIAEKGFEKEPTYCMRWVRQVIQSEFGNSFNHYFEGTAAETGRNFQGSKWEIDPKRGTLPGDIYFWLHTNNGQGHAGIRFPGNYLANNSTAHVINNDARNLRLLKSLGSPDVVVRLPAK